jgi:hypothetical protein
MSVIKFPHDACRRVHSRKPRRSKNGTPEERAAKAAALAAGQVPAPVVEISSGNEKPGRPVYIMTGANWEEFRRAGTAPAAGVHGSGVQAHGSLFTGHSMKRRHRSHRKRTRARLMAHARRLRR